MCYSTSEKDDIGYKLLDDSGSELPNYFGYDYEPSVVCFENKELLS